MIILRRGKITYYIKNEAVIVGISNFQFIAYTVYPLQNRKPFYDFRRELLHSKPDQYGDVVEQIKLGQRFGLVATASHQPTASELEGAEERP